MERVFPACPQPTPQPVLMSSYHMRRITGRLGPCDSGSCSRYCREEGLIGRYLGAISQWCAQSEYPDEVIPQSLRDLLDTSKRMVRQLALGKMYGKRSRQKCSAQYVVTLGFWWEGRPAKRIRSSAARGTGAILPTTLHEMSVRNCTKNISICLRPAARTCSSWRTLRGCCQQPSTTVGSLGRCCQISRTHVVRSAGSGMTKTRGTGTVFSHWSTAASWHPIRASWISFKMVGARDK